jgi:hypothetical protein
MNKSQSLRKISIVWILSVSLPIALICMQTFAGRYGGEGDAVWNWCLTQLAPVGALIAAAMFAEGSTRWRSQAASLFHHRLALAAVMLQGFAMLAALLIEPLIDLEYAEIFQTATAPLALVQGSVVALLTQLLFDGR